MYELLRQRCGLGAGSRVLEIGPGTGQATVRLLDCGATVTAVELGPEMAAALDAKYRDENLSVLVGAFEDVALDPGSFDLIVAATSFHWIPPETGLARCANLLRPGGWLAVWWTYFGDPDRPDPFRDAVTPIFEELSPSLIDTFPGMACLAGAHPYTFDSKGRTGDIDASGPLRSRAPRGHPLDGPPHTGRDPRPVRLLLALPRPPARRPGPCTRRDRAAGGRYFRRDRRTPIPDSDLPRAETRLTITVNDRSGA